MKKINLQALQNYREVYFSTPTKVLFQRYWLKTLLVLLGVFILIKKDISLEFKMHSAGTPTVQNESLVRPAALPTTNSGVSIKQPVNQSSKTAEPVQNFAVVELSSVVKATETEKSKIEVKKATIEPPQIVKETKKQSTKKSNENLANNFANLAFIMNPGYAKRKNISDEIVRAKNKVCKDYIRQFSPIAVAEMRKYGIPASITLAQGLLESNAGESRLTKANKNHFGIKCFSKKCGKNHCSNFTDDTHKDFFRKYNNAWESYRAHSLFLQGSRYARLKKLDVKDYKGWARGLKKCGYATDKRYADKLIKIIEVLNLDEYDG